MKIVCVRKENIVASEVNQRDWKEHKSVINNSAKKLLRQKQLIKNQKVFQTGCTEIHTGFLLSAL
jgi:hypothetical protein